MVKISELEDAGALTGSEEVALTQGGVTKKEDLDTILAKQHDHAVSDVTDFDSSVDARIDVPNDTAKSTPVDDDVFSLWDSVASFVRKKVTWANIKATLKTYFDTIYHPINGLREGLTPNMILSTDGSGNEGYTDPTTFVTIATDEEALDDAEEDVATNPKQVHTVSKLYGLKIIAGSTNIAASATTNATNTSTSYVKVKEIAIGRDGTYQIDFDLARGVSFSYTVNGRIYKNGVAFGTEQSSTSVSPIYTTKTENLTFSAGDTCELWVKTSDASRAVAYKDLYIRFDIEPYGMSVDLDN